MNEHVMRCVYGCDGVVAFMKILVLESSIPVS